MIKEHWLCDCQLHKLSEIHESYKGTGKAVDSSNPILPVQMPLGYGEVGVLWKKNIDHLITVLPEGGKRIQCVLLKADRPMLIVSVFMPCKGVTDCVDQLNDILSKYTQLQKKRETF